MPEEVVKLQAVMDLKRKAQAELDNQGWLKRRRTGAERQLAEEESIYQSGKVEAYDEVLAILRGEAPQDKKDEWGDCA